MTVICYNYINIFLQYYILMCRQNQLYTTADITIISTNFVMKMIQKKTQLSPYSILILTVFFRPVPSVAMAVIFTFLPLPAS